MTNKRTARKVTGTAAPAAESTAPGDGGASTSAAAAGGRPASPLPPALDPWLEPSEAEAEASKRIAAEVRPEAVGACCLGAAGRAQRHEWAVGSRTAPDTCQVLAGSGAMVHLSPCNVW